MEIRNPLKDVVASTFVGSEAFVVFAKEKLQKTSIRDVPFFRALTSAPTLDEIREAVASVVGRDSHHFRDLCLYLSHEHGGFTLNQIGEHHGMKGSAVSQASRRFRMRMSQDAELKEKVAETLSRIQEMLNVET